MEFHPRLYLVLRSTPDRIVVVVQEENILEHDEWFDEYEFISDDQTKWTWSPLYPLRYFQQKVFVDIQLEYRMVWLYFQKSAFLIQVVQTGVNELDVPVLTWQEGD